MRSAHLVVPAQPGSANYELNALALLMREWAGEPLLAESPLVTCLIAENLNDLHPLLVNNPRAASIKIPLPAAADLQPALDQMAPAYPVALAEFGGDKLGSLAGPLAGATLSSIENLLRLKEYRREEIRPNDVSTLKKALVEREANDLIEFIESRRTLDDIHAQDKLKASLREDIALWRQDDLAALPMGYLICGPVGTGKTFSLNAWRAKRESRSSKSRISGIAGLARPRATWKKSSGCCKVSVVALCLSTKPTKHSVSATLAQTTPAFRDASTRCLPRS